MKRIAFRTIEVNNNILYYYDDNYIFFKNNYVNDRFYDNTTFWKNATYKVMKFQQVGNLINSWLFLTSDSAFKYIYSKPLGISV